MQISSAPWSDVADLLLCWRMTRPLPPMVNSRCRHKATAISSTSVLARVWVALVLQGELRGGTHGVAMEIGHLTVERGGRPCGCGNRGCLEQYASTNGVVKTYAELTGKSLSAYDIAQAVQQNDKAAVKAFEQAGEYLASALAHITKVVDVGDVVVGGGMSASWSLMQAAFERGLHEDLIPALRGKVKVRISQAQDQAGIIGAAMLAGRQG